MRAVCVARPTRCGAKPITSSGGRRTDPRISTICCWYATTATKRSTYTVGPSTNTQKPASTTSNPPTPTKATGHNRGATQPARSEEAQQGRKPTNRRGPGGSTGAQPNPRDRRDQETVNRDTPGAQHNPRDRRDQETVNRDTPGAQHNPRDRRDQETVNRDTPGAQHNRGGRKGSEGHHFGGD